MTAEEFLDANTSGTIDELKCKELMIAFAKYHVEQALNEAASEGEIDFEEYGGGIEGGSINYKSILKAYPLKNIK